MFSPLDTITGAEKATRAAALAGVVSAMLTLGVVALTVFGTGGLLGGLLDAWALIDVAILLGLSYGTYRKSRASALGLLSYYLVNQLALRVGLGGEGLGTSGIGLTVVFTLLYGWGVAGAFAYQRLRARQGDGDERDPSA